VDFKALGYHFPGAYAQYMKVPAAAVKQGSIIPLPDNVTFEQAALVEPLSCVVNGQEYLKIEKGDTVVVFGAGPIGCMHAELARARGAGKVIIAEVSAERLEMARRVHADIYLNPQQEDPVARVMKETDGFGADVAICACSAPAVNKQALELAGRRGRISYFAGLPKTSPTIEFDCNRLHYNEISLFGAFASNIRQYKEALELVAARKFDADKFITGRFPLEGLEEAIVNSQKATGLKVVTLPQA
jgi:L-iditol 2-dehydrogenase